MKARFVLFVIMVWLGPVIGLAESDQTIKTSNSATFSAAEIQVLRQKVYQLTEPPEKYPDGWSISRVEPMSLLAVFSALKIKEDYVLRAYIFRVGGNGDGVVYALPKDAAFPEPDEEHRSIKAHVRPSRPEAATEDVMEAISGDGSWWSYLCASILARELFEFGALWHGQVWSTHTVLDQLPLTSRLP